VICFDAALAIVTHVARVRAGVEVTASPRLAFMLYKKNEEGNIC